MGYVNDSPGFPTGRKLKAASLVDGVASVVQLTDVADGGEGFEQLGDLRFVGSCVVSSDLFGIGWGRVSL